MSEFQKKYVPILKAKQGEFVALKNMAPEVRAGKKQKS